MSWFGEPKDLIAIVIATLAVILSLITVLALHPDGAAALLDVPGLVDHQDPVGVAECADHVVAQVIAHPIGVPARPGQEVLHAVRVRLAGVLGDSPAVLARQVCQQPAQEPPGSAAGLHPGEPPGHPIEQPVGLRGPPMGLYAAARGHRLIILRPHNRA